MVEHGWIEAISKAKRWLNIMAGEIALFSLYKKAAFLKNIPLYPELRDDLFRRRQKLLGFRCRNSEFDIPENALSRLNRVHFGSILSVRLFLTFRAMCERGINFVRIRRHSPPSIRARSPSA